jgi:hypothetical protein
MRSKMRTAVEIGLDDFEAGSGRTEDLKQSMNGSHFAAFRAVTHWQVDAEHANYAQQVFGAMLARRGLKILLHEAFEATEKELRPDTMAGRLLIWEEHNHHRVALMASVLEDAILLIQQRGSVVVADIASNELEAARKLLAHVHEKFPAEDRSEETCVPLFFWHLSEMGANASVRKVEVVDWKDIATNYAAHTSEQLEALMAHRPGSPQRGNLLLWHGLPGTGKTFAIRALAWAWRKWCRFEYIVDPEVLFGNGGYLNEVMLCNEIVEQSKKHRLLILEDCGEMMTADAKCVVGQGLSRLLNVSDGILGQASNLMILVTTNEDLGKLHPAVTRPGRCFSEIEFSRFSRDEANCWLSTSGSNGRAHDACTLSELYALRYGDRPKRSETLIGFRPDRAANEF